MILWNDSVNVECDYPPVHNLAIVVMQCAKEALSFAINSYCDYNALVCLQLNEALASKVLAWSTKPRV